MTAFSVFGSPTRTRTRDQLINSQSLYQLSYRGIDRSKKDRLAQASAGILMQAPVEVKQQMPIRERCLPPADRADC